jgi:hypothetical protein
MGSGAFALILIAGIAMFATGHGGSITWGLMAVGVIGLAIAGLSGRK